MTLLPAQSVRLSKSWKIPGIKIVRTITTAQLTIHNFEYIIETIVQLAKILIVDFDYFVVHNNSTLPRRTSIFHKRDYNPLVCQLFNI